jgi:transposase
MRPCQTSARDLFALQAADYAQLQVRIEEVEAKLLAWHRADECSRRLAKIPGIGPIGAAMLIMKVSGALTAPFGAEAKR